MEIIYSDKALDHIKYWKKSGNKVVQKKIAELLEDIMLHPFSGKGQPEHLKYGFSRFWSRRINKANRIMYTVEAETIYIHSLKGHYNQ